MCIVKIFSVCVYVSRLVSLSLPFSFFVLCTEMLDVCVRVCIFVCMCIMSVEMQCLRLFLDLCSVCSVCINECNWTYGSFFVCVCNISTDLFSAKV